MLVAMEVMVEDLPQDIVPQVKMVAQIIVLGLPVLVGLLEAVAVALFSTMSQTLATNEYAHLVVVAASAFLAQGAMGQPGLSVQYLPVQAVVEEDLAETQDYLLKPTQKGSQAMGDNMVVGPVAVAAQHILV